jgi:hypothetical protein
VTPTRRSVEAGPVGGSGPDYWVIEGAPLRPVLANLFGISETRIDLPTVLESNRFDFVLVLAHSVSRDTMIRLMRESVEKQFRVTLEVRPIDVEVLTAPNGIPAHIVEDDASGIGFGSMGFVEDVRHGSTDVFEGFQLADLMNLHMVPAEVEPSPEADLSAMRSAMLRVSQGSVRGGVGMNSIDNSLTMEELCQMLESGLDRPVVDETHLTGRYVFKVHSDAVSTRDFLCILCDKLGLIVTTQRRDVQVLTVRQR